MRADARDRLQGLPSKIRVLAMDTSTLRGSVALLDGPDLAAELRINSLETHSARLLRSVDFLLATAGWKLTDLGLVTAGIGPGSFTGIRIGISTALGLAQALSIPFCGVSGLDALASQVSFLEGTVVTVMDAQRSQVYYAGYLCGSGKMRRTTRPALLHPADLERRLGGRHLYVVGEAALDLIKRIGMRRRGWPRAIPWDLFLACGIGRLGLARKRAWRSGEFIAAEPMYIRPPDAVKPKGLSRNK